mmetsp:Transcript_50684/g.121024  ORF Transcript_50684/g.121024 Transcript_50684/m.121024 type:complete len:275 (-) Transcript_50684:141-965(-)
MLLAMLCRTATRPKRKNQAGAAMSWRMTQSLTGFGPSALCRIVTCDCWDKWLNVVAILCLAPSQSTFPGRLRCCWISLSSPAPPSSSPVAWPFTVCRDRLASLCDSSPISLDSTPRRCISRSRCSRSSSKKGFFSLATACTKAPSICCRLGTQLSHTFRLVEVPTAVRSCVAQVCNPTLGMATCRLPFFFFLTLLCESSSATMLPASLREASLEFLELLDVGSARSDSLDSSLDSSSLVQDSLDTLGVLSRALGPVRPLSDSHLSNFSRILSSF